VTVDSQRGFDIAVAQHRGDRLHVDAFRDEPACQTVAQIVPSPTLDWIPRHIEVAGNKLAVLVPLLHGTEDLGLGCCRVQVRLAGNTTRTRLGPFQLCGGEDPVDRSRVNGLLMPVPEIAPEHGMHCDGSLAVRVLAIADLLDPASPNYDPVPIILDIGPLKTEGFTDAQPGRSDEQRQDRLRLLQLVEDRQGLFRSAGDRLVIR